MFLVWPGKPLFSHSLLYEYPLGWEGRGKVQLYGAVVVTRERNRSILHDKEDELASPWDKIQIIVSFGTFLSE